MGLDLKVLSFLGHASYRTADEIRLHLEAHGESRTLRSVQRTLQQLVNRGELDCNDNAKPYGYKRKRGSPSLGLSSLSPAESVLLLLAQRYLQNILPTTLMPIFEPFFSEARSLLSVAPGNESLHQQWLRKVRVIPTTLQQLPPTIDPAVFESTSLSLYQNRLLRIIYRKITGEESEHIVEPWGLVQQGPRLYLIARVPKFKKPVPWAIHRITEAELLAHTFEHPTDFDLRQVESEATTSWGTGLRVKIDFWIAKSAGLNLIETPLSEDQVHTEENGGLRIRATVFDSQLLTNWINSYGEEIRDFRKTPL